MVGRERLVVGEFLIGEQGGEKEVAASLLVDEQRMFADPAQAGELSEFPFEKRRRIDDATASWHYGRHCMPGLALRSRSRR